jgi:hypothetical protein
MAKDLAELGLTRHKSQELKWPTNYPEEFMPVYIRGYFEGDGSINFHQGKNPNHTSARVSAVGTMDFIVGLKNHFSQIYGKEIGHIHDLETYAEYSLTGATSVIAFLDYIYKDSTEKTRMPRKYDKYLQFKNELYPQLINDKIKLDKITFEMAENIRKDRDSLTYHELSKKYNMHLDGIKNILDHTTHTKSDNRDSRSTSYITAFGETKHLDDWVEDQRCTVNEHTLYKRIYVQKMTPEDALTQKPDKTSGVLKHVICAYGEARTLTAWAADTRCKVSRQTLDRRIRVLNMDPEEAMTMDTKDMPRNNVADGKLSNNQKVTEDQVLAIRHLYQDKDHSVNKLADMFMLSKHCVSDIVNYRTFKDLVVLF